MVAIPIAQVEIRSVTTAADADRFLVLFLPELENLKPLTRETFKQVHDRHWQIESFHRVIKQVCNIERF